MMIYYKTLTHDYLVSFLGDYVEKFLVKGHRRKKRNGLTFAPFGVNVLLLAVDSEFRDKAFFTNGALYCVVTQILLETSEYFFFP